MLFLQICKGCGRKVPHKKGVKTDSGNFENCRQEVCMKKRKMKKVWLVLGICMGLLFGMSTVVSAAKNDLTVTNETKQTLPAPSYMKQTAATTTSVTVAWGAVSGAQEYQVELSSDGGKNYDTLGATAKTSVRITGLKADKKYAVRVFAYNSSDWCGYYRAIYVWTAPKKVSLSKFSFGSKGCTFYMKNPGANVDGYKVTYKNYKTGKSTTKYASGYKSFSVALSGNCFYKVTIAPFVKVDNKIYAATDSITTYIASQPKIQKKSNTKSSMTVKWAKTYGASSYSVYLKKPGASSFSKVATTTALSYTVKGMKIGSNYQIKVLANKKVGSKTYQSQKDYYYTIRLYYTYR